MNKHAEAVRSFLQRQHLEHDTKDVEYGVQFTVRQGSVKAVVKTFDNGTIQVQGSPSELKSLLEKIKEEVQAGGTAALRSILPTEVDRLPDLLLERVPTCDPVIIRFLKEALMCFKSDALLGAFFMLGAASEKAIALLIDTYGESIRSEDHKTRFKQRVSKSKFISARWDEFRGSYASCKTRPTEDWANDLDASLNSTVQFLRITRNEIGHPQIVPDLDKGVFLANLSHFVTYMERIYRLKKHFEEGVDI